MNNVIFLLLQRNFDLKKIVYNIMPVRQVSHIITAVYPNYTKTIYYTYHKICTAYNILDACTEQGKFAWTTIM